MSSVTRQPAARKVIVGVDTHKHVHVAVAVDILGTRLGDQSFVADSGGYQALITWAEIHGPIEAFGIEGTGSYGAGLAGTVRRAGHRVIEVNRGDRRTRRAAGQSDTIDAEVAARSVLAGQSTAIPKTADGAVEMIRQLKVARDTAVKARTVAMITLKQIVVRAPAPLREALQDPHRSPSAHTLRRTPSRPTRYADRVHQTHPSGARPPVDDPRRGNRDTRPAPRATHDRDVTDAPCELRGRRPHGGRDVDPVRRQPGPDSFRSRLRKTLRRLSHPGLVRDDHWPAPPQSGRPPTGQRRPLSSGHRAPAIPSADCQLRRPTHGGRPDQT